MADDPIQDDHPELPPRSAPKPEREPIVIEGQATDLTPREADAAPAEAAGEPISEEPPTTEPEPHVSPEPESSGAPEPESAPIAEAAESPAAFAHEDPPEPPAAAAPEPEASPRAPEPETPFEAPGAPRTPSRSGFGSAMRFLGYAAALVILVVAALFVGAWVHNPFSDAMTALQQRVDGLEAGLKTETAARSALEARVAANEAKLGQTPALPKLDALEARVAKLEAAAVARAATPAPPASAAAKPAPAPVASAAPAADSALADRVAKLEAAAAAPKPAPAPAPAPAPNPDVAKLVSGQSALDDRIAKLEAALAAQKSEARAAPIALAKGLDPVAEAVAAISLAQRLAAGEPYAAEYAALAKSGADAGALAALKPWADSGAPTPATLAVAFDGLAPSLAAPVKSESSGKVVDKMMDQLRGLVKIHAVGEIPGDDPVALESRISAALARGDVASALANEAKLPDSARAVAASWVKDAEGLEKATAAARSLAETALRRFAEAKN